MAAQLLWRQRRSPREAAAADLVAQTIKPDYALGLHIASLGLAFGVLPGSGSGAFVGLYGSWNCSLPGGYKVIVVPFADGRPSGPSIDVLTGFLSASGDALGWPVGVALDRIGALLVAEDVSGAIWRVSGTPSSAAAP